MTKEVREYILINNGATTANGKLVEFTEGFAVAVTNYSTEIYNSMGISAIENTLKAMNYDYIGYWLQGNKLFIDGVCILSSKCIALLTAKQFNQQAIWDFKNNTEVKV